MFKNILVFSFFFFIFCSSSKEDLLKVYGHYKADEIVTMMPTPYIGPLFVTGMASYDMNRFIKKMEPTKIGSIDSNRITLIGEDSLKDEIYIFKTIQYYEVSKDFDTFFVAMIDAQRDNKIYEILIELKDGPNYDRTLKIFQNKKPYALFLWVENMRLVQKKNSRI